MADLKKISIGAGLVFVGFFPTPDDVTIISPALQIIGGSALIVAGLVSK